MATRVPSERLSWRRRAGQMSGRLASSPMIKWASLTVGQIKGRLREKPEGAPGGQIASDTMGAT